MTTVVCINSDGMGRGNPELGAQILQTFFNKATALRGLDAVVFYNGGVKLLAEGSAVLPVLSVLEDNGVDLIACGTCVDSFELRDRIRVGEIGSMDKILNELDLADKVITL